MPKYCVLLVGSLLLTACGHNFNQRADTNSPPDPYFVDRDFVKYGVPENGDRIDDWIGKIATWDGNEYIFYSNPYLLGKNRPVVTAEQKNYSYHTTIDKNWSAKATLPFLTGDATGKTATQVSMVDTANVAVVPEDEPARGDAFNKAAQDRGIADPTKMGLYWVKGVALEVVSRTKGTSLDANANVNGDGFGASGGASYDATETQTTPLISVEALPMNAMADAEVQKRKSSHEAAQQEFTKSLAARLGSVAMTTSPRRLPTPPALYRNPQTGLVSYRLVESPPLRQRQQ